MNNKTAIALYLTKEGEPRFIYNDNTINAMELFAWALEARKTLEFYANSRPNFQTGMLHHKSGVLIGPANAKDILEKFPLSGDNT